jgi:hypothetical protein
VKYGDWLFLLSMLITGIVVPYESAMVRVSDDFCWPLIGVLEGVFVIQMVFSFHTAVALDNGQKVDSCDEIAAHYVKKGSFLRDILALIPLDLIAFAVGSPWVWVFRLPKMLRVCGLFLYIAQWIAQLKSPMMKLKTARCALLTLLTAHSVACAWYVISCPDGCSSPGWVTESRMEGASRLQHYVNALYWTMATMTTTGYGDFTAKNDSERIFAVFAMIGGKLLFGSIFANVASTQANADYQRIRYRDKILAVRAFFNDRQIAPDICVRIQRYYEYLWTVQKGWNIASLFEDMPYVALFLKPPISYFIALSLPCAPCACCICGCRYMRGKGDIVHGVGV